MKYGLTIFPTEWTVQPDVLARRVEERGFESLWFPEHTHIPVSRRSPWPGGPDLPREYWSSYDPFVALGAAAAATRDLNVATGICLVVERDPIVTAKEVATLDRLSGGRFIFGIGGGWNEEEMEDHGTDPKRRFGLLRERILAMKTLWTQHEAEYHGRFVSFDRTWADPKPVQKPHPPIYMGGDSPRTLDRVVEFCDGWMPIFRRELPDFATKVPEIRRRAEASGRDPDSIAIMLWGCPARREVVDEVAKLGVQRVVFGLPCVEPEAVLAKVDEYARLVV